MKFRIRLNDLETRRQREVRKERVNGRKVRILNRSNEAKIRIKCGKMRRSENKANEAKISENKIK